MEKQKFRLGCILLALTLIAALTMPALAATPRVVTRYNNAKHLFSTSLQGDETLERSDSNIKITRKGEIKVERSTIRDLYQSRAASGSITLSEDAQVANMIEVQIPKGETLTVEEGATLTVYGILLIEGKLVNNGTIILGYKDKEAGTDKTATLHNRGRVTNSGKINVRCGELVNDTIGKLQNKGSIEINNKLAGYSALQILARQSGETLRAGEITNSGTILVKNTKGIGILIQKNAVLQNDGEITLSGAGNIDGKVMGSAVKTAG